MEMAVAESGSASRRLVRRTPSVKGMDTCGLGGAAGCDTTQPCRDEPSGGYGYRQKSLQQIRPVGGERCRASRAEQVREEGGVGDAVDLEQCCSWIL